MHSSRTLIYFQSLSLSDSFKFCSLTHSCSLLFILLLHIPYIPIVCTERTAAKRNLGDLQARLAKLAIFHALNLFLIVKALDIGCR